MFISSLNLNRVLINVWSVNFQEFTDLFKSLSTLAHVGIKRNPGFSWFVYCIISSSPDSIIPDAVFKTVVIMASECAMELVTTIFVFSLTYTVLYWSSSNGLCKGIIWVWRHHIHKKLPAQSNDGQLWLLIEWRTIVIVNWSKCPAKIWNPLLWIRKSGIWIESHVPTCFISGDVMNEI